MKGRLRLLLGRSRLRLLHRAELAALEIEHRLLDLAHGIHDEWTLGHDRLVDRCTAEDQHRRVVVGLKRDVATIAIEQYDLLPRARSRSPFTSTVAGSTTTTSVWPSGSVERRLGCVPWAVARPRHQSA